MGQSSQQGSLKREQPDSQQQPAAKRQSFGGSPSPTGDSEGLEFNLGSLKRVKVETFRGQVLIDIREMYERDGQQLPGKKGE